MAGSARYSANVRPHRAERQPQSFRRPRRCPCKSPGVHKPADEFQRKTAYPMEVNRLPVFQQNLGDAENPPADRMGIRAHRLSLPAYGPEMGDGEPFGRFEPVSQHAVKPGMGDPKRPKSGQNRCSQTRTKRQKAGAKSVEVDEVVGDGTDPWPGKVAGKADVRCEKHEHGQPPDDPVVAERKQHERRQEPSRIRRRVLRGA